jgi:NAD(P)-dependent dehydrogenase (short-subunit alcohol dehydrogenase family)
VVVCSRSQNDVDKTVQEIKSLAFFENKGGRKSKGLEKIFSGDSQQEPTLSISDGIRRSSSDQGEVLGFRCDVSISSDIYNLVDAAVGKFGRIDILINNAGIFQYKNLTDIAEE